MSSDYNAFLKRNLEKVLSKFGRVALKNKVEKTDLTSALQTEINSKASTSDLNSVASSVSTVSTGLSAVDTKVNTLIGDDQNKSARTIADEEVAKVIADAPASFDTLKEIADWIGDHADDAAQMNSDIIALKAKTVLGTYIPEGEVDPVEYATVKAYVEAYVAEHSSGDISVPIPKPEEYPSNFIAGTTAGNSNLNNITYGKGVFVAVGDGGSIYYSEDGKTWTAGTGTSNVVLWDVAYAYFLGIFVAVGVNGANYHSADGKAWTAGTSTGVKTLYGIAVGEGEITVVGADGYTYSSTDGETWISAGIIGLDHLFSVAYGRDYFVAVGASGASYRRKSFGSWSTLGGITGGEYLYRVAYGNNLFVAVGVNGVNYVSELSTGPKAWSKGNNASDSALNGIAYGNQQFVAVGSDGRVSYSRDGLTWAGYNASGTLNGVVYGDGIFVTVGNSGINYYCDVTKDLSQQELGLRIEDISNGICAPHDKNRAYKKYECCMHEGKVYKAINNISAGIDFQAWRWAESNVSDASKQNSDYYFNALRRATADDHMFKPVLTVTGDGVKTLKQLFDEANFNLYNTLSNGKYETAVLKIPTPNVSYNFPIYFYHKDSLNSSGPFLGFGSYCAPLVQTWIAAHLQVSSDSIYVDYAYVSGNNQYVKFAQITYDSIIPANKKVYFYI